MRSGHLLETGVFNNSYEEQIENLQIVTGTPKTVIPKIRHVLEYLRPGSVFFWDGDGAMTHEDSMRSLRLFGEEVIPAVKEIAKELELDQRTIAAELEKHKTLSGKARSFTDKLERDRKSVKAAIGRAISAIRTHHRPLARHLASCIDTGRSCVYRPDRQIDWFV